MNPLFPSPKPPSCSLLSLKAHTDDGPAPGPMLQRLGSGTQGIRSSWELQSSHGSPQSATPSASDQFPLSLEPNQDAAPALQQQKAEFVEVMVPAVRGIT